MSLSPEQRVARSVAGCAGVLGLALLTCCGPDERPIDAGAARDAATDGGRDAALSDGGLDAGPRREDSGPVAPTWLPLEGLPEGCELSMAADPEAVVAPLRFEACPDMEGCRQVIVDWSGEEAPRFSVGPGNHTGEHGYFFYGRGAELGWIWWVIARDDGRIMSVVRSPIPSAGDPFECYLFNMTVSEPRAAITVATGGGGAIGDSIVGLVDWRDGPSFRVLATLTPSDLGPNNYVHQIALGDGFVAGQVVLSNVIVRVGFDGTVRWVTRGDGRSPFLASANGDAVFIDTYPYGSLWMATSADTEAQLLWTPPSNAVAVDINADPADFAWARADSTAA